MKSSDFSLIRIMTLPSSAIHDKYAPKYRKTTTCKFPNTVYQNYCLVYFTW